MTKGVICSKAAPAGCSTHHLPPPGPVKGLLGGRGPGFPAHKTVPILLPGLLLDFREGQSLTVPCPASRSLWAVPLFQKQAMGLGEPETLDGAHQLRLLEAGSGRDLTISLRVPS